MRDVIMIDMIIFTPYLYAWFWKNGTSEAIIWTNDITAAMVQYEGGSSETSKIT